MCLRAGLFTILVYATCATVARSQGELPSAPQPGANPAPQAAPATAEFRQQVSYALGRNFAMQLQEGGVDCDLEFLTAGINDALSNAQPKWTEQQLNSAMQRFVREMQQKAATKMQAEAEKNQKEADAFLAENGKKQDVQTTPSGLQYRVLKAGNGPSPTLSDTVRCTYRGTLLNGTEFDSSARHGGPVEFPVTGVIPGWTEALQKMKIGDKWQLFIPPKLAYEMNPPGRPIEANSLLVFEMELVEILKP
jgi:FKBP-type peptidyl-prolyl cis-trans isomerase FklB